MSEPSSLSRLSNKTIIVTGGASGMGRATCLGATAEDGAVVVCDTDVDRGVDVVDEIVAAGGSAIFAELDVRSVEGWVSVVEQTLAWRGGIDGLVNNAGASGGGSDPFDIDVWHKLLDVNLTGPFLGCRAVVPQLIGRGGGSIVNISSIAGLVGPPGGHLGYPSSKGGVRLLSKSIAAKYGPVGVRCNSVHPGWMPPMRGQTGVPDGIAASIPLRRMGVGGDVVGAIVFLLSDESAYISGTEIVVDGGFVNQLNVGVSG